MFTLLKRLILNQLHLLRLPELDLPKETIHEFDDIYDRHISTAEGKIVPFECRYPKYMFLNYLIETKDVLVHGTNKSDIVSFEPRKQTLFNGKPVKAVFAASDGVWSLFFAVINRVGYVGSLRNLCITSPTKKGIKRYYYFSLNKDFHGECWSDGTIYFLPKKDFKPGGIKDEWICETAVKPLAKMTVTASEFPFKEHIFRHSETDSVVKTWVKSLVLNKKLP
ncbi:hypothetical protein DS745_02960 [Anaerobacillus alkaliphilus]|uniref:Uncharacterized protein n=1 Tax=Anaerobacillus alkaliphilus TaxID=1548597 RepID=A0A4Q0VY07_9BACI|nr:hypothetical protein [Anaerobacillus alkaliphilus]RXJ04360.1 hypothetical protein DS745_02960 [Anaerobacillus alkaliphilus]